MTVQDNNLIGERLPNEQIEDEALRAHYEQLDTVDLRRLESQVKSLKGSQFQPIAFRKKTTHVTNVAAETTM